jgi:formylglycine-generating enzyme required for sulfatase activity
MLGTTEVTQGLFEEVMGFNPSATKGRDWRGDTRGGTCAAHGVGPELPVTCVTWDEAVTFCNKLSVRHGRDLAYSARGDQWVWNVDADGFRLPTEAEWEWAASRELATAGEPVCGYANVANVGSVKLSRSLDMRPRVKQTYDCEDGFDGLATAGALGAPPDSGGVRDLLGNVWEWTWDLHAPYPEGEVSDPQRAPVPTRGDRVLRGGSWANPPGDLRVRNRFKGPQDGRSYLVGFRVARTAEVPATDVVSMVGPELAAELSAIRTDFGSAASAPQVAAVWSRSMEVMIRLNHRLEQYYYGLVESGAAEREVDLGLINGTLPGLAWTWGVEGIGVTSEMKAEPWRARAIATPEQADDVFFDLMQFVYGGPHRAHARPWAIWDERNWDYGGCSGLGSGVVADGLVRVDEALAAGPGFEVPIGEVRADALRAILKDNPLFPYCDGGSFEPTKDEALRDEVRRILKTVRLTDAEKATLEARIPELKGAEFTGG